MFSYTDDINLIATSHTETVVCMINQNSQAKHYVNVGIDAEEYYKIKDKSIYAELCANFCNERALELKKKQLKSIAVDVPNKLSPLEARNSY